jgi:hypothetical protein
LAEVEQEIVRDGTFEIRLSATRRLLEAGFSAQVEQSVAQLEVHASSPAQLADVALLAAQAGLQRRAATLAERADDGLQSPADDAAQLAICAVTAAFELLGDHARASRILERLVVSDRRDCEEELVAHLAKAGQVDRARTLAEQISQDGASAGVWLAVARASASHGDVTGARDALRSAVPGAGRDVAKLSEAADVYALIGDGKEAARLARRLRERVLRGTGAGEPAYLIRATLAGGDRAGAAALAAHVGDTPSLIGQVQAGILYLDFDIDPPPGRGADRRVFAEQILSSVERALAAEKEASYADSVRAHLAHARLKTGDIRRALEHARAVSRLPTRLAALVAVAQRCAQDEAAPRPS